MPRSVSVVEGEFKVETKFIASGRHRAGGWRDEVRVLHLRHAARSAGEAFAFEDEFSSGGPERPGAAFVRLGLMVVAAIGLAIVKS